MSSVFDPDPLIDRYTDWLSSRPFMVRLTVFLLNVALIIYGWSLAMSRAASGPAITDLAEAYITAFVYMPFIMGLTLVLPTLAIFHFVCLLGGVAS